MSKELHTSIRRAWSPKRLSSLRLLLLPAIDASMRGLATSSTASLDVIEDQSGNGFDATQSTADSRPTLLYDDEAWVYRFDGTDDYLTGSASMSASSAGYICIAVKRFSTDPVTVQVLLNTGISGGNNRFFRVGCGQNKGEIRHNDAGTQDAARGDSTFETEVPVTLEWASNSSTWTMYVNQVAQTLTMTAGANEGDWTGDITSPTQYGLGALVLSSVSAYFGGDIAAVIVCDAVPSATERTLLHRWLTHRAYGLRPTTAKATGEIVLLDAQTEAELLDLDEADTATPDELEDYSGHSRRVLQDTSALRGTLLHTGDRWAVRLNGTTQYYASNPYSEAISMPFVEALVVETRSDTGAIQRVLDDLSIASDRLRLNRTTASGGGPGRWQMLNSGGGESRGVHGADTDAHVIVAVWNGDSSDLRIDGLNAGIQQIDDADRFGSTVGISIGGTLPAAIDLSTHRIYSGTKTRAQLAAIEAELASRFDIDLYSSTVIEPWGIANLQDCDGVCAADFAGTGTLDIVAIGHSLGVFLYRQGADAYTWTRTTIKNSGFTAGFTLSGIAAGDFDDDGKVEIIVGDQTNGEIWCMKQDTADPYSTWSATMISSSYPGMQALFAWDIDSDGIPEFMFAFEGDGAGVGGVSHAKLTGSDPLDAGDWTFYVATQHDGAWGIANANIAGRFPTSLAAGTTDIVFSARTRLNPSADGGLYYITKPAVVTDTWTKTTITNEDEDWSRLAVGNFYGDGNQRDVIATWADQSTPDTKVYAFRASEGYATKHTIYIGSDQACNAILIPSSTDRDRVLVPVASDGLYILSVIGVSSNLLPLAFGHTCESSVMQYVDLGDGINRFLISDSNGNRLFSLRML